MKFMMCITNPNHSWKESATIVEVAKISDHDRLADEMQMTGRGERGSRLCDDNKDLVT
jgi:hypothetical protein